jgi:hypothetical protein
LSIAILVVSPSRITHFTNDLPPLTGQYHRFHPLKGSLTGSVSKMSEAERAEFTQEIAIFVTTFASEVRELRQTIRSPGNVPTEKNPKNKTITGDDTSSPSKEEIIHKNDIASYLLEVRTPLYIPSQLL